MTQYIGRDELRRSLKAMNIIDAIVTPPENDWLRMVSSEVFEDNTVWYVIDNGSGDELKVIFTESGIFIKGFDHENELNQFAAEEWDSSFFEHIFSGVPKEMLDLFTDDERDYTTFCMWYLDESGIWHENVIEGNDGGKSYLLGYVHQMAKSFYDWADEYYNITFDYNIIQKLFDNGTLSVEDILTLNPKCDTQRVLNEVV